MRVFKAVVCIQTFKHHEHSPSTNVVGIRLSVTVTFPQTSELTNIDNSLCWPLQAVIHLESHIQHNMIVSCFCLANQLWEECGWHESSDGL